MLSICKYWSLCKDWLLVVLASGGRTLGLRYRATLYQLSLYMWSGVVGTIYSAWYANQLLQTIHWACWASKTLAKLPLCSFSNKCAIEKHLTIQNRASFSCLPERDRPVLQDSLDAGWHVPYWSLLRMPSDSSGFPGAVNIPEMGHQLVVGPQTAWTELKYVLVLVNRAQESTWRSHRALQMVRFRVLPYQRQIITTNYFPMVSRYHRSQWQWVFGEERGAVTWVSLKLRTTILNSIKHYAHCSAL